MNIRPKKVTLDLDNLGELGQLTITRQRDPKSMLKDEVFDELESKKARDMVKGQVHHLANHEVDAGMIIHIPNHLQKDFKTLMRLAFLLEEKYQNLKRNVKFDEESLGLYVNHH